MFDENYSTEIEIGGEKYNLVFTTGASIAVSRRFGGIGELGDALSKPENTAKAFEDIVWLITTMANQGIKIENRRNHTDRPLLTEEDVELFTSPSDITTLQYSMMAAISRGTQRNVRSEEDTKNRDAG